MLAENTVKMVSFDKKRRIPFPPLDSSDRRIFVLCEGSMKSTVQQIRERFDRDVERFSQLEIGNAAQVDSVLSLELIAQACAACNSAAKTLLDVGCGAGNYSLKVLERLPALDVTLLDLSRPMLDRALQRLTSATSGRISILQADIREALLADSEFDLIVASAVLHHLRSDQEWAHVFTKLHRALKPNGTLWIYDLVQHDISEIQQVMWNRYGRHLTTVKDEAYRHHVFSYIEEEDTPRSLAFQLGLLRSTGFRQVEVLHANTCFAAFGARK